MNDGPAFFVHLRAKASGPFSLEQLRELAAAGHIGADTEVAMDAAGPWSLLGRHRVASACLPRATPRFEVANSASSPPIDLQDLIAAANRVPGPPPGASAAPASAAPPPVSAPHDVPSLLQFNLALERQRGLHRLAPLPERRSRRRRDYFLTLTLIGVAIFGILLVECYAAVQIQVLAARMPDQFWPVLKAVVFHSPIFFWGLALFAVFALVLWWLIYVVIDER